MSGMFGKIGESTYTKSVRELVRSIRDSSKLEDSLYEQASAYFSQVTDSKARLEKLSQAYQEAKEKAESGANKPQSKLIEKLEKAERALKAERTIQQEQRQQRYQHTHKVLSNIIYLSEGEDWEETQVNSAKVLGTLFLLSPAEGNKLPQLHQRLKPLYTAVMAVRLLDKMLQMGVPMHDYIQSLYDERTRFGGQNKDLTEFQEHIVLPVLVAAMYQDVGLLHPDAQSLLRGGRDKLSEFRLLSDKDRLTLLKLNHQHTQDFIINGLGVAPYRGNSRNERDDFVQQQRQRLAFALDLLNDAVKPKRGLGNIVKAPQIYTSVVLSTKQDYNILDVCKASKLLEKVAEKETISTVAAEAMMAINGHFPQGFGVVYIPVDDKGQDLNRYEYAIVNQLNPNEPDIPQCRLVTRNLTFNSFGQNARINTANNLFFTPARKKLSVLSEAKLKEIMTALYSNYHEEVKLELLPRLWRPYTFFCYQAFQNLWNKNTQKDQGFGPVDEDDAADKGGVLVQRDDG